MLSKQVVILSSVFRNLFRLHASFVRELSFSIQGFLNHHYHLFWKCLFLLAQLGLDVRRLSHIKFLHISLNIAHSGCRTSNLMMMSFAHSPQVFLPPAQAFHPGHGPPLCFLNYIVKSTSTAILFILSMSTYTWYRNEHVYIKLEKKISQATTVLTKSKQGYQKSLNVILGIYI